MNDLTKLLLTILIIIVSGTLATLSGWIFSESVKRDHGLKSAKYCNTWTGVLVFVVASNLLTLMIPFIAALFIVIFVEMLGLNHGYRAVALAEDAKRNNDSDLEQ